MSRFSLRRTLPVVSLLIGAATLRLVAAPSSPPPPLITPPTPKVAPKVAPKTSQRISYNASPGELVLRGKDGKELGICPLKHTAVEANIAGFVARVHVKQQFINTATTPVEAIYTFPLPNDAAVDDMTMHIGKRMVKGQIKKREEARQIYEAAKNAGQTAALLDQERPNIFTQAVANLMPGQDVTIDISFVNTLKYEDGQYEWAFPTVVGPRYTGGSSAGKDPAKITPPITPQGTRAGHDISIEVNLDAGLPLRSVSSPLHPIDVQKQGATRALVQLRDLATLPNKDFILRYKVAGEQVQGGVIAYAPSGSEGGYFTLILQPPDVPKSSDVASKEMVFVIDQTGSQQGAPIEKAKEVASYCIENLNPGDTFQLIGFNTDVYPCFPAPVEPTKANISKALAWLKPLAGAGGTDILKAADYALKIPIDRSRPRIICQMTDGYVGNDTEIIQHVAKNRGQARMFPFGTGNGVNRYLIDGMALEGRGVADYVTLTEDGREHAKKFYERIAQPLLLDVSVDWGGLPVEDVLPRQIPDVFSSTPIILKGRYKRGMKGEIIVRGLLRGQPWQQVIPIELPEEPTQSAEALPSLWAREKINDVEMEGWKAQISGKSPGDTPAKVTALALEYRLMSAYTSFVAVEQRVVNIGGQQRTVSVPVEMPEGVSYEGIFGGADGARPVVNGQWQKTAALGLMFRSGIGKSLGGQTYAGLPGAAAPRPASPSLATPSIPLPMPKLAAKQSSSLSAAANAPVASRHAAIVEKEVAEAKSLSEAELQKSLAALKPEEKRTLLRRVKLAPALQKTPTAGAKNGRVTVQIWIANMPKDGLAKLKAQGFELAVTLTTGKLLLGTVDARKLDGLIALSFVRFVEAPQFTS